MPILRNITPEPKDENHLWQLLLQGDKIALSRLMDYYLDALYNYGIHFSVDHCLVEDCIQELFTGIWQRRDFLSMPVNIKSYLFSSLRRMILRKTKSGKKVTIVSINENENDSGDFDFEISVEQAFIRQEETKGIAQKIKNLIAVLPKRQKEMIYLKFFENLRREEIAEIMQITPQAVSNLLQKALKNMRSDDEDSFPVPIILLFFTGFMQASILFEQSFSYRL